MAEERHDVARGGQPDAQHQRIFRRVDELVQTAGAERVLDADPRGIGCARPRRIFTVGECPAVARHHVSRILLPGVVLAAMPRQRRARLRQTCGKVRLCRAERREANRDAVRAVGKIEQTGDHPAGNGGAVFLLRHWNDDGLVGRRRYDIALPAADEHDVPSTFAVACPFPRLTT
jgi:hypothetical protein